ncbi:MAG TPA: hypothetical protein PLD27_03715 [bacterium]|mgnify:CR=1 FL=1|nr:hypothetical protein [bacterium]HOL47898.1 hypothetical protein [bacterium]HPQ17910.1 hypothetical protein [bacterium]
MDIKKILDTIKNEEGRESILLEFSDEKNEEKKYIKGIRTEIFETISGNSILLDIDNETNKVISLEIL